MSRILLLLFILSFNPGNAQKYDDVFISQQQLKKALDNKRLTVIHVDYGTSYDQGHIPGAVFMNSRDFTVRNGNLSFEIPAADSFAEALRVRGIDHKSEIVICSGWDSFEHAYRLYFTLDYYGLGENTRVLDGGIRAWYKGNNEISTDSVAARPAKKAPELRANPEKLASKEWIMENMDNQEVKVLDARTDAFYTGKSGSFRRGGHIRNAGRVTWTDLVDDDHRLMDRKDLARMFRDAGADKVETVATYCHIGLRASVLYAVAKSLGYEARLYDGSMNEWEGLSADYPVDKGN